MRRTLTLKRDVLQELTTADLNAVVGGLPTGVTGISCLAYVSCWVADCLPETLVCVE
jgi:hypothetical protein